MKASFDTSALIPVFLLDHPNHIASLAVFRRATQSGSFAAAHTPAELYSTLTRLPYPYRISPPDAAEAVQACCRRLTLVSLRAGELVTALGRAARLNIQGGTLYDFLIASCAVRAEVDLIYTWNLRHYQLFGAEIRGKLRPPDQALA